MIDLEGVTTVADVPRFQARRRGAAIAVTSGARRTSFADLDAESSRIANTLIAEGVPPDRRVAYLAKNDASFLTFTFGCCKAGAVLAPINFRLAPAEIAFILQDCGAPLFIVGVDFAEIAERAVATLAQKPRMIALDFERPGFERYSDWIAGADARDPMREVAPDDDLIQLYTSGTTGHPKGVRLTHANYLATFRLSSTSGGLDFDVGDAVLGAMPFFHVAGVNIALIAAASGARTVVVRDVLPDAILDMIARERINHAFLAPAIILMLLNSPGIADADLGSMKTLSYGASTISEDVLARARARFKCDFVQFYGMTETTGVGTYLPRHAHDPAKGKLRSCGVPWPGVDLKIVAADGAEVARGEIGEIVITAPMVMKGYWNQPDVTREALRDGGMHTGDVAYMDEDGYVFIYDRLKDLIVTGGENVYPAEVENALFGHPDLADVAVIGVPDANWGEAVKAVAVAKPGAPKDAGSVIAWARARIANFKVPKSVDFVEAIPRNLTGKVLRRELRKPYWEGRDRQVG
jgi:acyl-CoA synthetase (AMP-forming)/AMP-acid ligase II